MPKARRGRGRDVVELLPTRERYTHGPIERLAAPIRDANEDLARPLKGLDTLSCMVREGTITDKEKRAGDKFHRYFRLAMLDRLYAADTTRLPVILAGNGHRVEIFGDEAARLQVRGALDALGGQTLAASCAWYVLGCEMSLARWSVIAQLHRKQASGILLADLGILRSYFF